MVRLRAIRAIDDVEACEKFIEGHSRVLNSVGIKKVTSSSHDWTSNPAAYMILAESENGEKVFGGARVHKTYKNHLLPIEEALKDKDAGVFDLIKVYDQHVTGELCGLWNSIEVAGMGLGITVLSRACIIITEQLGMSSLFALCSPYTARVSADLGFILEPTIGNNGTFFYPKEDLIATVKVIPDCIELQHANQESRSIIQLIRSNLNQNLVENTKRGNLTIEYQLQI